MRTFPQELVNVVIDELAGIDRYRVAPYSLVSKTWVTRTQERHFEWIYFNGWTLEKWRRKIAPDPAGVSRHTRHLVFADIDKPLEGFDAHMRAFTLVEDLEIAGCNSILSLSIVECFAPMGSSLIRLRIYKSSITLRTIVSLLAVLPQLKSFITTDFIVIDDTGGKNPPPQAIPFFEGNNSLVLGAVVGPPASLDWILPSARFSNLKIGATYFLPEAVLVNRWLSSSCTTLTSFTIQMDVDDFTLPSLSTPLDLSPCSALARLYVPAPFQKPGIIVEMVLPSITSSKLSYISLEMTSAGFDDYPEVDYSAWAAAEKHFCRLAKRFSAGNPGEKMVVRFCGEGDWGGPRMVHSLELFGHKDFFPRLKEEATFMTAGP